MEDQVELHIWGESLGMPSIDAECIAAVAYFVHISQSDPSLNWVIVSDYDTSLSPNGDFPLLSFQDGKVAGFQSIVQHLKTASHDLDSTLDAEKKSELSAWSAFVQERAQPLLDLYLYVSYYNYWDQMSPGFTKILPWYANYVIPPSRRAAAIARTKHLGIRSLDIDNLDDVPKDNTGRPGLTSATTGAGINPAQSSPEQLLNQQRTMKWLRNQRHSDSFQLYQMSKDFFGSLEQLLGDKVYLLTDDKPSSIDCLAIGYLSPMLYAPVTHKWLADALKQRHPKLRSYVDRMYCQTFKNDKVSWKHKLQYAPTPTTLDGVKLVGQSLFDYALPSFKTTITPDPSAASKSPPRTTAGSVVSNAALQTAVLSAGTIAGIAFAATKHMGISEQRDDNVFFQDRQRPVRLTDMGEAGAALAAFGERMDFDVTHSRERERLGGATIVEVDVESKDGDIAVLA